MAVKHQAPKQNKNKNKQIKYHASTATSLAECFKVDLSALCCVLCVLEASENINQCLH